MAREIENDHISQYSILSKVPKWQSCIGEHAFLNNQPEAIVRRGNSIMLVKPLKFLVYFLPNSTASQ